MAFTTTSFLIMFSIYESEMIYLIDPRTLPSQCGNVRVVRSYFREGTLGRRLCFASEINSECNY